ncbi:hypothetical protein H8E06_00570 [bacterium]|nr:hypothetical protein [bacterium]
MKPGTKSDNQILSETYNQVQEAGTAVDQGSHGPFSSGRDSDEARLNRSSYRFTGGAAGAQQINGLRDVITSLRSGALGLVESDKLAGTLVVRTEAGTEVTLKVTDVRGRDSDS